MQAMPRSLKAGLGRARLCNSWKRTAKAPFSRCGWYAPHVTSLSSKASAATRLGQAGGREQPAGVPLRVELVGTRSQEALRPTHNLPQADEPS